MSRCFVHAGMAELADALDSGSSEGFFMQVQVLFPAPTPYNPNRIFPVGDGFGLLLYFDYKFFRNGMKQRPESKPRDSHKKRETE